jgi:hypothetical protein
MALLAGQITVALYRNSRKMVLALTAQSIKDSREMVGCVDQIPVAPIKDFCRTDLARPVQHIAANRMREVVHLTNAKTPQDK